MKNIKNVLASASTLAAMASIGMTQVFAEGGGFIENGAEGTVDGNAALGGIIDTLCSIAMYVGIALAAYGVYEVVQSFMQNQPEAKTKGIVLAANPKADKYKRLTEPVY